MDEQNQVQSEVIHQTDLGQILDGKPLSENSAPQKSHREQSDAASPGDNQRDGNDQRDNSWTFKAFESEKKKRQALAARLKEAEEERDALLFEQSQKAQASPEETQHWLDPYQAINEVTIKQNGRASRAEFIAEHGRSTFLELDRVVDEAAKAGHPDIPLLSQKMRQSDDPVSVMAQWASEQLGWGQQQQQRQTVMPTNLAGARNVGKRFGPTWSGPTPLGDIFDRKRKND